MGTSKSDKHQTFTQNCTNQTRSCLMHNLNTFGARTSHGQTRTHKTHHNPNLGEAITFPFMVYYVPIHEAHIQITFCPRTPKMGIPKFPKLKLSGFWGPITFCANLLLRWGLKQSCSLVEIFPTVCHVLLARKEIGSILDF
jgi:hypothetical protein